MDEKGYLNHWLLPFNGLQDGTLYAGCPVGNIHEFMPLDNSLNSLNRDIWQSLRFSLFLSLSIIDGKEITEEERKLCFSFSTPREIVQGLKRLWDSKMGTPSLARIIQDVNLVLKALEMVYRENGAAADAQAYRAYVARNIRQILPCSTPRKIAVLTIKIIDNAQIRRDTDILGVPLSILASPPPATHTPAATLDNSAF